MIQNFKFNYIKKTILIDYFEYNYLQRRGKGLSAAIKIIDYKWKLGVLAHISAYECYFYSFTRYVIYG